MKTVDEVVTAYRLAKRYTDLLQVKHELNRGHLIIKSTNRKSPLNEIGNKAIQEDLLKVIVDNQIEDAKTMLLNIGIQATPLDAVPVEKTSRNKNDYDDEDDDI